MEANEELDQELLNISSSSSSSNSSSKLTSSSQYSADCESDRFDKSIDESRGNRLPGNDASFEFSHGLSDSSSPNTSIEEITEEQENLGRNRSGIMRRRVGKKSSSSLKRSAVQDKRMPLADVPGVLNQQLTSSSSEGEFERSIVGALLCPGSDGSNSSSSSQYSAISESERFGKSIDESCSTRAAPKNNNSRDSSASSSPNTSIKVIIEEPENVVIENGSGIKRRPQEGSNALLSLESELVKDQRVPLEDLTNQLYSINCDSQKGSIEGEFEGSASKLSTSAGGDSSNSSSKQGSHDIRAEPVRNTYKYLPTFSTPSFTEEAKAEQENVITSTSSTKSESIEGSNTLPSMKSQPTKGPKKPFGDVTNQLSSRSHDNQNGSLELIQKTKSSTSSQQNVPHRVLQVHNSTMLSSPSDQEDS